MAEPLAPQESPSDLPGAIALLAWLGGTIVALLVPLIFLAIGYQTLSTQLDAVSLTSSRLAATAFSKRAVAKDSARFNPQGIFEALAPLSGNTKIQILDHRNQVLVENHTRLERPLMTRTAILQLSDQEVWRLELRRSLRPLLYHSLALFVPGLLLGWLCFVVLRMLPTRAFHLTLNEIEVRKATEERLARSLSLFSATLESTADGILVTDSFGRPVVSNQRFLKMWRIAKPINLGGGDFEAISILASKLRDSGGFLANQRKLADAIELEHGEILELLDGRVFEWYSQPQRVDGVAVGQVSSFRDISERKRAEVLLSAEKQVLEMVVSGAPLVEALSVLARHIEMLSNEMFCSIIFREDAEGVTLHCATGPSLPAAVTSRIANRGYAALAAVFDEARRQEGDLAAGFPNILDDEKWAGYRHLVADWGLLACFSVPICSSTGSLLGVIVAHYRSPSEQQPHDLELVRVATNLTSIAIERRQAEAQLDTMAHFDALTQLPNRLLFRDRLHHAMARSDRSKEIIAVMFLDLDRFKTINDTLGHDAGDLLLREVSSRLCQCVRAEDTVARLGGDEFTIILEQIGKAEDAAVIANKILETLTPPFTLSGQETFVTSSIGITVYPSDSADFDGLVKNADTAMYRAKGGGGNGYRFFTPEMNAKAGERLKMESGLRRALERNEFVVYYQPKVDLRSGKILGAEALLRWRHPEWGLVSPSEFVPILEETGLIEPVGEWVLRTVCMQIRSWQANPAIPPLCVAVNLSGRQLQRGNLATTIGSLLEETGLAPHWLELEVTESMLMHDPEFAADMLRQIRAKGIMSIDVDDFGTGYSSLSYLKRFPIDSLKLDKSFVQGLPNDEDDIAISKAVIALAHSLKLKVIAEGVETSEQFESLRQHECDVIQGYIVSPPLPADAFAQLAREYKHMERWLAKGIDLKPGHTLATDHNAAV
ncbi:EAL domain-containing protein [Ramlibacter sp. 2FC]|uniref:sensor domain-containing protein n=1 Tax=Ramlibacter sp. 2FC TaxID=2502188 RepID=UPI0010F6E995|nr:EAL domain-containing protein [Ramlibacter sp. 2FC]